MTLFYIIIIGNWGKIFAPEISPANDASYINIGGGDRIFASLLSISIMLLFLFLFPSFVVGGVIIFRL